MEQKINEDMKEALKNGDKFRLSVLRMMKSALQLETINKKGNLEDKDVITVLKRQVKQRTDSMKEYTSLGKEETAQDLQKEIYIINTYLPKEASEEEIAKVIDLAFAEINPTSMKEMGMIMKYVTEHLENADMSKVSEIVRKRLVK